MAMRYYPIPDDPNSTLKDTYEAGYDPKDQEVFPAPKQYHKINCRYCGKKNQKVSTKFYLSCNKCRANTTTYRRFVDSEEWQQWQHTPFY